MTKLMKTNGWILDRISGSHYIMVKAGKRSIPVPVHGKKDIPTGSLEPVGLTPHGSIFALSLQEQTSCLLLPSRLRSLSPPSMAAFLRYCSALSSGAESTTRTPEASLLLASGVPPSFAFAALHGGFSSLSLSALFGRRVYDSPPPLLRCQNTHVA